MKSAFPQSHHDSNFNAGSLGAQEFSPESWPQCMHALRSALTPALAWVSVSQSNAVAEKAVSLNRKKTIFYPIGWLAILAVAAWFSWLTIG
jgi:hypothetical protein